MKRRVRARLALAAGIAVVGAGAVVASSAFEPERAPPQPAATVLEKAPRTLLSACEAAAEAAEVPPLCPRSIPRGTGSGRARAFEQASCEYLVDVEPGTGDGGPQAVFHLLFGGRCRPFDLRTRNRRWPAAGHIRDDLRLVGVLPLRAGQSGRGAPARAHLVARLRVGGRPALLVRHPAQPLTTIHGGHLAVVWNEESAGYVVSGHPPDGAGPEQERRAVRALRATAVAMRSALDRRAREPISG